VTRRRLDSELVRRGLATSRAEAQQAVHAGLVRVGGVMASKVATLVADDEPVELAGPPRRFVSRGGEKLAAAIDRFAIEVAETEALDAGASTGGFTDCLLHAGARHVIAVDVGYGQLAWELRRDARVSVLERTNVRSLRPADLPYAPAVVVADLSFISLRTVLPALAALSARGADAILLVKPQFEAGPGAVGRGGVVRDPGVWLRVLSAVSVAAADAGFSPQDVMASPIRGPAGNVEFLLWGRRDAVAMSVDLEGAVAEAQEVAA
jgi:23S rRNA (cytidine1920-2'-O)/16S rRNA (cytidine1409-2'-O)-methyltransferase